MIRLAEEDRVTVRGLGRIAGSAMIVHQSLLEKPLTDSARLVLSTGLVPNTVNKVLMTLVDAGLVREVTGRGRNRVYAYQKFIEVMNEGTEIL